MRFKAVQYQEVFLDKNSDYMFAGSHRDTSIVITISMKEKTAVFHTYPAVTYDIIAPVSKNIEEDISMYKLPVMDRKSKKCVLRIMKMKLPDKTAIYTVYLDYIDLIKVFTIAGNE